MESSCCKNFFKKRRSYCDGRYFRVHYWAEVLSKKFFSLGQFLEYKVKGSLFFESLFLYASDNLIHVCFSTEVEGEFPRTNKYLHKFLFGFPLKGIILVSLWATAMAISFLSALFMQIFSFWKDSSKAWIFWYPLLIFRAGPHSVISNAHVRPSPPALRTTGLQIFGWINFSLHSIKYIQKREIITPRINSLESTTFEIPGAALVILVNTSTGKPECKAIQ